MLVGYMRVSTDGDRQVMDGAHTRAFEAIGAVPNLLVPHNTKVAVIRACLYEPQVNSTYAEMAVHYDTAVLPARPRRPRDKAKVEAAVLIIERWLLGRLRHRRFYSLAELNAAIGEVLLLSSPAALPDIRYGCVIRGGQDKCRARNEREGRSFQTAIRHSHCQLNHRAQNDDGYIISAHIFHNEEAQK